jgi:hypothetical protein
MLHIHHKNLKQDNEHYYAVVTYNVDDRKLVTIKDLSLHAVLDNIVQENNIKEFNQLAIKTAVDILILDNVINSETLLYNL